ANLEELTGRFEVIADSLEDKRSLYESKRRELDEQRSQLLRLQREQFEAEKSKAIADTTLANLMRAQHQSMDDKQRRTMQLDQLKQDLQSAIRNKTATEQEVQDLEETRKATEAAILNHQEEMETRREHLAAENRILDAK